MNFHLRIFILNSLPQSRAVASRGAGGALAPPVFGQTVNPISTRGADYTHHSTKSPSGFSDLVTALTVTNNVYFYTLLEIKPCGLKFYNLRCLFLEF